jgi:hypothetical protein
MAINSNASTEVVQGGGIQLYSGIANFKVIAVNPTMEELHALDINVKTEPNYSLSTSFGDRTKLTFWVQNDDLTTKVDILVSSEVRETKAGGKFQWINSIGQSTWADDDGPKYDWWKTEGQRKAYIGEETLIFFTKAWANVATGDEVSYETIKDIVNGNVKEIKGLISALKDNMVRVLVGVKDDKYQSIYTKYFGRIKPQRDDMFIKMLKDDYGTFNADFNADLKWGEHTPTADGLTTPDALNEDDDWVFPDKPQNEKQKVEEEAPF